MSPITLILEGVIVRKYLGVLLIFLAIFFGYIAGQSSGKSLRLEEIIAENNRQYGIQMRRVQQLESLLNKQNDIIRKLPMVVEDNDRRDRLLELSRSSQAIYESLNRDLERLKSKVRPAEAGCTTQREVRESGQSSE